jgi:hypothetical protein
MINAPATPPSAAEQQQETPLRIVRGGVTSDAITENQTAPGIYHLPDAPAAEAVSPQTEATPPQNALTHDVFRSKKPAKRPLRREARNRAPGFNDAFGGPGQR